MTECRYRENISGCLLFAFLVAKRKADVLYLTSFHLGTGSMRSLLLILLAGISAMAVEPGQGIPTETPKDVIEKYQFKDFRGPFAFLSEETLTVLKPDQALRVLQFGVSTITGRSICIVLLAIAPDGSLKELYKTTPASDSITPNFEGLEVIGVVQGQGPYLLLRWRVPGSGGIQKIDVLKYSDGALTLVSSSTATGRPVRAWTQGQ